MDVSASKWGRVTQEPEVTKLAGTQNLAIPREHLPPAEDFLLWPPALQVYGFRIVDRLFASRPIRRGSETLPLERGTDLDLSYVANGQEFGVGQFMDRNRISGLLVVKDGKIRLERYGLGLQPHDRWSTMSTVKSMTAMLVGAAVQDALIQLSDSVASLLPGLAGSAYEQVTVRDLLTMSSGVAWTEIYSDKQSDVNRYSKSLADMTPGGVLEIMRKLPAAHQPGTKWHYNTGDTYVLGAALSAATKRPLAEYMSDKVWRPCGMEFDAYYTLESANGQEIGGSRAGVALRDFGRFALLVLNDGIVNGRQVVPVGWVKESGTIAFHLTEEDKKSSPRFVSGGLRGYGYCWWIDQDGAMIANGFAGQRIYINVPESLAIITLGAFPQQPYIGPGDHDFIAEVVSFTDAVRSGFSAGTVV